MVQTVMLADYCKVPPTGHGHAAWYFWTDRFTQPVKPKDLN